MHLPHLLFLGIPAVLIALAMSLFALLHIRDGQDVTHSSYNGYKVRGVYCLKQRMKISGNYDPACPGTYDVLDTPSIPPYDIGPDLPVGTRIRFDKTIWIIGHLGGAPVPFGTVLDSQFKSHLVNLVRVSKYTGNRHVQPDPEWLSETSP